VEHSGRGWLFAFEGLDGSGKSTQLHLLEEALCKEGYAVVATREPTDGPYGRRLRQLLGNRDQCTPDEELALFIADRRQHVETVIKPALVEGKVVLTDRYYLSTAAYQGALGHDPEAILIENELFAPKPDLVFLLSVSVETGLSRITEGRGESPNDFEKESSLLIVRKVFSQLSRPFIRRVDASRSIGVIHQDILALAIAELEKA